MPEGYREVHNAGTQGLRLAAHARAVDGNEACGAVYTMLGRSFHNRQERLGFVTDPVIESRRLLVDVGTPILSFNPDSDTVSSFFGPVISTIPRGSEALKLWDAIETLATTSGMAELKRSLRAAPSFD